MEEIIRAWPRLTENQRAELIAVLRGFSSASPTEPTQEFLTARQVSVRYGVSLSTIYTASKSGKLKKVIPNGMERGARYKRMDVEKWLGLS